MRRKTLETQADKRTERVGIAVTPEERKAVEVVAAANGVKDSLILRKKSLNQCVREYRKLKAIIGEAA